MCPMLQMRADTNVTASFLRAPFILAGGQVSHLEVFEYKHYSACNEITNKLILMFITL